MGKNFLSSRKWSVDFAKKEMRNMDTGKRPEDAGCAGSTGAGGGGGGTASAGETDTDFETWLKGLDAQGTMIEFLPALSREFLNLHELCNAVLAVPEGGEPSRPITCIEPAVYEALGMIKMGQKLIFAKGVLSLAE